MRARTYSRLLCLLCLATAGGCGGADAFAPESSATPPEQPPPPAGPLTVAKSLTALGVDVDQVDTPRLDSEGRPYPATYSPLGDRFEMTELPDGSMVYGRPSKLMTIGIRRPNDPGTSTLSVFDNVARPTPPATLIEPTVLSASTPSWAREQPGTSLSEGTLRDAVASDLDGDGHDELVFVHVSGASVRLEMRQGDDGGANDVDVPLALPFAASRVSDLRIASGDFDGDGRWDLAVGISRRADRLAEVYVLRDQASAFAPRKVLTLPAELPTGVVQLVLCAGSVDYDGADELIAVVNERAGTISNAQGKARIHVFDDATTDFEPLHAGPVVALLDAGEVHVAVADVDVGDLDGDGAGELLLAGVDAIVRTTNNGNPGDGTTLQLHVLVTLDDALHEFAQTAACTQQVRRPQNPENDPWMTAFVHANVVDIDGDEDLEIQVDGWVFDRVPEPGVSWDTIPPPGSGGGPTANWAHRLRGSYPFPDDDSTPGWVLDRGTADVRIGDVDGDGRQDVITYRSGAANGETDAHVEIHGTDLHETNLLRLWGRIATQADSGESPTNPLVLPVAATLNGQESVTTVFAYVQHFSAFTEPWILAVMAAPPCIDGIDQNYDDCTTTWGLSRSTGIEGEREVKLSIGVGRGFKFTVPWVQIEVEAMAKLQLSWSRTVGEAYEVTKAISYTGGPREDCVVFSSLWVDGYEYEVIQHPDASRVGEKITLYQQREPVIRIAEVSYYDAHLPPGALRVGDVLQHTVGDIDSYPSTEEKEQLLDRHRSLLEDSRVRYNLLQDGRTVFDPVEALRGLDTDVAGVGEGGGSTEVTLEIQRESSEGRGFTFAFEIELETTVSGRKWQASIGFEADWTTKITFGSGTNFVGTVGSIGASDFAENQYRFGLFTYLQADPTTFREFHVVNYWVER